MRREIIIYKENEGCVDERWPYGVGERQPLSASALPYDVGDVQTAHA